MTEDEADPVNVLDGFTRLRWSRPRVWLTVAGLLAVLGGCDSGAGDDPVDHASPVSPSSTTTVQEPLVAPTSDVLEPGSRIVQQPGWIATAWSARSSLPAEVDATDLAVAPYLHESPIGEAVLAVGTSSSTNWSPLPPGTVALVGTDGELRRVSLEAAGLRRSNSEQPFELNARGTMLALGDQGAIVVVSLKSGTHQRYPSAVRSPVAIQWTPSGDRLIYAERHGGRGYELRLTTGKTRRTAFNPSAVAPGDGGTALGFTADEHLATAIWHWQDRRRTDVPLNTTVQPDEPPSWRTMAAFTQRYGRLQGRNAVTGFVVLDPASGSFDAVLPAPARYLNYGGIDGWWGETSVVFSIQLNDTGGIYAWNYKSGAVRRLSELNGPGMLLSLAQDNLSPR